MLFLGALNSIIGLCTIGSHSYSWGRSTRTTPKNNNRYRLRLLLPFVLVWDFVVCPVVYCLRYASRWMRSLKYRRVARSTAIQRLQVEMTVVGENGANPGPTHEEIEEAKSLHHAALIERKKPASERELRYYASGKAALMEDLQEYTCWLGAKSPCQVCGCQICPVSKPKPLAFFLCPPREENQPLIWTTTELRSERPG